MQKEIFEQPRAVSDTLEGVAAIGPHLFGPERRRRRWPQVDSVLILACGTSYYSSLVAKQWIESLARIPCAVEIASEYRYRDSVPSPTALVIVVSQSGETADTLAALKHAKALGHTHTLTDLQRADLVDGAPDRAHLPDARRRRGRASPRPRRSPRS